MRHPVFPWLILIFSIIYVLGLSYYAEHQGPSDPSYSFYDSTTVEVVAIGLNDIPEVYGQFNNILEGRRQIVAARMLDSTRQQLTFRVNSPRPAIVYLNEEAVEVILLPGDSTLQIQAYFSGVDGSLDSTLYHGNAARMATYYRDKKKRLQQQNIRASRHVVLTEDFGAYSKAVDSMAAAELVFLVEQEVFSTLPEWFVQLEKNEILYQKAYLKLSAAYNSNIDSNLLDQVNINNQGAVFSYYYYLYLNAFFSHLHTSSKPTNDYEDVLEYQLKVADSLLNEEPHDVFISRIIFQQLAMGNYGLSEKLYVKYQKKFNSQKYKRYLKNQLLKSKEVPPASARQ